MSNLLENVMRIKILKDDDVRGLKAGEVYVGTVNTKETVHIPKGEVMIFARLPDGHDPRCNVDYKDVAHWHTDRWYVVVNNNFRPENWEELEGFYAMPIDSCNRK